MTYDAMRRLLSWQNAASSPTSTASYAYDGEGNRVWQQTTSSGTTTTTTYVGTYEEIATTGSTTNTIQYFQAGPVIVVSVNGNLSYFVRDFLGSVAEALTSTGNVQADELYLPYGSVRYASGTMPTSYGFIGQRLDPSGLMYFNARYYDGTSGQFINADLFIGQNRYAYAIDNPIDYTDPTGLAPVPGWWFWYYLMKLLSITTDYTGQQTVPLPDEFGNGIALYSVTPIASIEANIVANIIDGANNPKATDMESSSGETAPIQYTINLPYVNPNTGQYPPEGEGTQAGEGAQSGGSRGNGTSGNHGQADQSGEDPVLTEAEIAHEETETEVLFEGINMNGGDGSELDASPTSPLPYNDTAEQWLADGGFAQAAPINGNEGSEGEGMSGGEPPPGWIGGGGKDDNEQ